MKSAIHFIDYDKISDTLMYLGKDITMKFNVSLAYKTNDGMRKHFHSEFLYETSKYNNVNTVCSIKRQFDYYISIDVKGDLDNSLMIRASHMIMFKLKLKQVASWFTNLFKERDDKLVIEGEYTPIELLIGEYKKIEFVPTIIYYEDENLYKEGIRMYINSDSVYCDLSIDRFMELWYLIDSFDMYLSATVLLDYLRPDFGRDIMRFSEESDKDNKPSEIEIKEMEIPNIIRGNNKKEFRKITGKNFFNK